MTRPVVTRSRATGDADVVRDARTALLVYAPWRRRRHRPISRWAGRLLARRDTRAPRPAPPAA